MAKYNFTTNGGLLVVTLDVEINKFSPEIYNYRAASVCIDKDQLYLNEFGIFKESFKFNEFGTIGGVSPTSISNASLLINNLISTASVASSVGSLAVQYNTIEAYDTVLNLPITFGSNTLHSISVLCKTGITIMTIGIEQITLEPGQSFNSEVDGLMTTVLTINSCTGTFLATVSKL